jgi:UDP-N-acetylglucosamine/UDP-N-acetylgalactosamine 4-epimerase
LGASTDVQAAEPAEFMHDSAATTESFCMAVYLVTGGAGFIGSHLVDALLGQGHTVRVLDNLATGNRANLHLATTATQANLELIWGDLRSYHIVQEAVQGVEYILHQAALPSVPRSVKDPLTAHEVNVAGTLNLLHVALKAGVKRLVFASSSSIYGDNPTLPKVESMTPTPRSPYAITKLTGELYCKTFWDLYGLETVCLRYFNVFGPRQDPNSFYSAVIPKFITAAIRDEPVVIHGDGEQSRDFTYVDNVVRANLLACQAPEVAGQAINISCGERYSLLSLVEAIGKLIGKRMTVEHVAARPGDVKHSQADIERAGRVLGYEPSTGFFEGLKRTVAWYLAP